MESDSQIYNSFSQLLWSDIQSAQTFPTKRPLLAHYTSIAGLECIMAGDEVWFSNPLYMSDLEELRFGMREGAQAFGQNEAIRSACGSTERYNRLIHAFDHQFDQFSDRHAFDIYVFCMSEHDVKNTDGLLSMWRGYGGNGNGAAIIFDSTQLNYVEGSPLVIANVTYASRDERLQWIDEKLSVLANSISSADVPDEKLHLPAYAFFERLKIFSIFTKHHGFSEEKEWRAVYMRERDRDHKMENMLGYAVGKRGIEPKLKLKIGPIEGFTTGDISLEKIVHQIILGPSVSSPLAVSAVRRMLEKVGKHGLASKLTASTTPFRSVY